MANEVKMAVIEAIKAYAALGWSNRKIGRELGIRRETVSRHLALAGAKPAILPAGAEGVPPSADPPVAGKPANVPTGKSGRVSQCEGFRTAIETAVEAGLSSQRIYQDLTTDSAYTGGYDAVKRFVRHLRVKAPERFHRLETLPGEEAQVDFGVGIPIIENGKRRKTWVFRIVLSFSRKAYSEVVFHQTTDAFIRAIENAFRYFGGATRTLVIDNLRAAVSWVDWYEPELNPKVREFASYYGTVILPTRPYTPRHKGKIERQVGYVKGNALKGRSFTSLAEENTYLLNWESQVADLRIHGTTRRQVLALFQEERPSLLPLPISIFPSFQEGKRRVHRDSFVEVQKAYYEVPEEYMQRDVWVRWDGRTIRVFNDRFEQVAMHAYVQKGKFSHTNQTTSLSMGVEQSAASLLLRAIKMGPHSGAWADTVLFHRGAEGIRPIHGLLALPRTHSLKNIERACSEALTQGRIRFRELQAILKTPDTQQTTMPFLETHPLIRDIGDYGQFLHDLYPDDETTQPKEDVL